MCWTCNINKLKAQTAKEDINVYKVVKKATKKSCVSPFIDYTYYSKDIPPSLTLGVIIEPCLNYAKIEEGYYGYSSVNFVYDSVMMGFNRLLYKAVKCGNREKMLRVNNSLYLATFVIPAGSTYFINEEGVIVSNKIRYTGRYLKL